MNNKLSKQTNSSKVRSSNIELLRIVAMLMIVAFHISYHAVRFQLIKKGSMNVMDNGVFCYPYFYKKLLIVEGFMPFGMIGNDIFMLISGYFMVEKGKDINIGNVTKKLLLQVGFATLALTLVPILYYKIVPQNLDFEISLRNTNAFNSMSWFVGYYYFVIVIAWLFLNKYLQKADRKTYRNVLLVTFGLLSLGWSGDLLEGLATGLRTLMTGIFLYALGGYIKLYNPFGRVRAWALILVIVILFVLIFVSYHNIVENNIHGYNMRAVTREAQGKEPELYIQTLFLVDNYGFIPIVIAIAMFEMFSRIKMPNSKVINLIASGTLMVYLLHDNEFWRLIWRKFDWITCLSETPALYCLKLLEWTAIVFGTGIILYFIYMAICKLSVKCKGLVLKPEDKAE